MSTRGDRRKYPRVPKLSLAFVTRDGDKNITPGLMVDVSLGGMKILTQVPIEKQKNITIHIEVNRGKKIEIPAEIVWQQKFEILEGFNFGIEYMYGVEFKLSQEEIQKKVLENFIYSY